MNQTTLKRNEAPAQKADDTHQNWFSRPLLSLRSALSRMVRRMNWRRLPPGDRYPDTPPGWVPNEGNQRFSRRLYASYKDYVEHQRSKLDRKGPGYLVEYDRIFFDALVARLEAIGAGLSLAGRNVLCLAARIGTEVRAFSSFGSFAVGIDLNPGPSNKHVLPGDFHALQFPNACVDVVYTNSFDHAFDEQQLAGEICRVLKPSGWLLLEIADFDASQQKYGSYESLAWSDAGDVTALFAARGFMPVAKTSFQVPWKGTLFLMQRDRHHDQRG